VFFAVEGARIVLLLSGFDKGVNPSEKCQGREIKLARTFPVRAGGVLVARSYEDVVAALRPAAAPDLDRFAQAAEAHFEEAYRLTFGLGEAVAARRQELNLSQTQLAAATGIPQADISRIERGKGNPTLATIEKLLAALQLTWTFQPSR
jgi:DNA-binding XRE family transcriptional regulator